MADPSNTHERVILTRSDEPGRRLDAWLRAHYAHVSRTLTQKLIRKGNVRINGKKTRADYHLQADDKIELPLSFAAPDPGSGRSETKDKSGKAPLEPPQDLLKSLRESVLFEDEHYLCLNKPPGLCVHAGTGVRYDLKSLLPVLWPQHPGLELAHRLDKETSGCLVLTKSWDRLQSFHRLLRERLVEKEYLAVLHRPRQYPDARKVAYKRHKYSSSFMDGTGRVRIELPLSREPDKPLEAHTEIFPIRAYANAVLARITISTGRYHQIRRHAASIQQPLVGDGRYGLAPRLERALGLSCSRLMLHSHRVNFIDNRKYRFISPLPAEIETWLENLK